MWALLDEEKRREAVLRRISKGAWTTAFLVVLAFTIIWAVYIVQMVQFTGLSRLPDRENIIHAAIPLFVALGFMSVLVATVSTVGVFMRFRAASLSEIQLRLAALEDVIMSERGRDQD
jgi:hypothetical protein